MDSLRVRPIHHIDGDVETEIHGVYMAIYVGEKMFYPEFPDPAHESMHFPRIFGIILRSTLAERCSRLGRLAVGRRTPGSYRHGCRLPRHGHTAGRLDQFGYR